MAETLSGQSYTIKHYEMQGISENFVPHWGTISIGTS